MKTTPKLKAARRHTMTALETDDSMLDLIRMGLIVPNGKFRPGAHGLEPVYVATPGISPEQSAAIVESFGESDELNDKAVRAILAAGGDESPKAKS